MCLEKELNCSKKQNKTKKRWNKLRNQYTNKTKVIWLLLPSCTPFSPKVIFSGCIIFLSQCAYVSHFSSVQSLSSVWLFDHMGCSMPGLPVHHQSLEPTQTHVHGVGDAIQPSHPLLSPLPLAFNLSQHQGLFKWVSSSYQVAKVLEFQLQHQSFQWTPRTDLL